MNSNRISYANVLSETQFVQLRKQIPTLWFDTCSYTPFMFKIEILILRYCLCLHNCYWFHTWSYTTFMFRIEILILKHCLVLLNCYGDSTHRTEETTLGFNVRRKCFQLMILTPKLLSKSETALEQNNNTDVSRYLYCIWE